MAIRTGRIEDTANLEQNTQCAFLAALARGAELLGDEKAWSSGVLDFFAELGRATKVNRIWLFQVLELSDKHMLMNFPYEWVDEPKYELKVTPRYDIHRWDFETCSSVYRSLVESRRRREWQTIMIDELEECDFKEYQQAQGIKSTITIPVIVQGEWWGLFGLDDCKHPREWSAEEKSLLRMVTHLLSTCVLRDRMNSTQRQFEILSNITESSAWELDVSRGYFWCSRKIFPVQDSVSDNIHMTLLQVIRQIHPDDRKSIWIYLRELIKSGNVNFRKDLRIRRGNQYIWNDIIAKISFDNNNCISNLSGIIVEIPGRKAEEEKLQRQANIDALTGIANRGAFDSYFKHMKHNYKNGGESFCFLLLDVDYFKRINDQWGHSVGDMVLKHIADVLQNTLRSDDFLARVGGEEFAILLHATPRNVAESIAERLCQNIERTPLIVENERISVTISIGLTCLSSDPDNRVCDDIYQCTDRVLYEAKRNGRNRVVTSKVF